MLAPRVPLALTIAGVALTVFGFSRPWVEISSGTASGGVGSFYSGFRLATGGDVPTVVGSANIGGQAQVWLVLAATASPLLLAVWKSRAGMAVHLAVVAAAILVVLGSGLQNERIALLIRELAERGVLVAADLRDGYAVTLVGLAAIAAGTLLPRIERSVNATAVAQTQQTRYCAHCGQPMSGQARFCAGCGRETETTSPPSK